MKHLYFTSTLQQYFRAPFQRPHRPLFFSWESGRGELDFLHDSCLLSAGEFLSLLLLSPSTATVLEGELGEMKSTSEGAGKGSEKLELALFAQLLLSQGPSCRAAQPLCLHCASHSSSPTSSAPSFLLFFVSKQCWVYFPTTFS